MSNFATNTFADIVNERPDRGNPFTNEGTVYTVIIDEGALNARVIRSVAKRPAASRLRSCLELSAR